MDPPSIVSCKNIWSWAASLAVSFYIVQTGNNIQPVFSTEVEGASKPTRGRSKQKRYPSKEESTPLLLSFEPLPDTNKEYNFDDKVSKLPFKFNLGDAPFNKEQQDHLLNLVYNQQTVFFFHNEDLGFVTN